MSTKILPVSALTRPQPTIDLVGNQLENPQTNIDTPDGTDTFVDIQLSANDTYIVAQLQTSNELIAAPWADGDDPEWGAGLALTGDVAHIAMHPVDPTLFMTVDSASASKWAVYQIDSQDYSITKLASISETITSAGIASNMYAWNDDGTRFVATNTTTIYLYSWNGSNLTQLDSLVIHSGSSNRPQCNWVRGADFIFCGNGGGTILKMVSAAGDSLSEIDSYTFEATNFCRSTVSPDGGFAYQGGRPGVASESIILPINSDGTFGTKIGMPEETNDAHFISASRIVTVYDDDFLGQVVLYDFDGLTLTETDRDSTTLGNAQGNAYVISTKPQPPPTIQQQFETTYADVSGRDPLPTALTSRDPARNLVNYLVGIYAGNNPRIVRKPVLIQYGELDKVSPAPPAGSRCREIWIKDPRDPNFKTGRRALILGRAGGADPGVVELTLFIADNAESFVEPN